MTRALHRLRARAARETGMTLVELMVAGMILSFVLLVFLSTMASVQRTVVDEQKRSEQNNQVRLAIQSIDRQARSGNLMYDPSTESPACCTLRIYTQANLPTAGHHCALWQIDSQQRLLFRSWPPLQPGNATPWTVKAEHVVNRLVTTDPAFSLDPAGRTITITFFVNSDLVNEPNATQQYTTSVTGRNTSFGFPADLCEVLPT